MIDTLKNKDLMLFVLKKMGIKDFLLESVWKIISSQSETTFINEIINFIIGYHGNNLATDLEKFIINNKSKSFEIDFYFTLLREFCTFGIVNDDNFEERVEQLLVESKGKRKERIEVPLNEELVKYIDDNIVPSDNELDIAYSIYYLLGNILCYDYSYAAVKNHLTLNKYYDVSPSNPYVICDTWAMIYYLLLRRYGIESTVTVDEKHAYVIINIQGTKIIADATKFINDSSLTYMSDLANIKYGFRTIYFEADHYALNNNLAIDTNKIESSINYVTSYYGDEVRNDVNLEIADIREHDTDDIFANINRRFEYLSTYYLKLPNKCFMDKRQFFEKYFPILFSDFEYSMNSLLCLDDGKFCTRRVISFKVDGEDINYMEGNNGFRAISSEELECLNKQTKSRYSEIYEDKHTKKRS